MSPMSVLRHAAADNELRDELLTTSESFGISTAPTSVEPLDEEAMEFWTEGVAAVEVYACATSCSAGPFTVVCDGGTKA